MDDTPRTDDPAGRPGPGPDDADGQPRVFVSYAGEEGRYAQRLQDALERLGYEVWLDQKIRPGSAWHDEIERRLAAAGAIIVLWSKRSAASDWVRYEAAYATGRGVYDGCRIEGGFEIPPPYGRLQVSPLVGWDGTPATAGFPSLLASLQTLVGPPRNPGRSGVPGPPGRLECPARHFGGFAGGWWRTGWASSCRPSPWGCSWSSTGR